MSPRITRVYFALAMLLCAAALGAMTLGVQAERASAQAAVTNANAHGPANQVITATCPVVWNAIDTPQIIPGSALADVAAAAPGDAWAVGYTNGLSSNTPLIEHWNGASWSIVPGAPTQTATLNSVVAVSANDVWAVGEAGTPLIEHWNGSAWSVVSIPVTQTGGLSGITAITARDIWAVGSIYSGQHTENLTLHWNGTAWSVVPSPNAANMDNSLAGVSAVSSTDVWAVGNAHFTFNYFTVALHWDGTSWTRAGTPSPGFEQNILTGVHATSTNDVWAVGLCYCLRPYDSLVLHWDGTGWGQVDTPVLGTGPSPLSDVWALDAQHAWAVGNYTDGALVLEWDGTAWHQVPSASMNSQDGLAGIGGDAEGDIWAVGTRGNSASNYAPLVEYRGFLDVHPSDWFYEYAHCLYCEGAISGYADSTFRPYNNTTRGQMTKIIVRALHIPPPPIPTGSVTPTFNDVPPDNPFYSYVESAAASGIVSGYSCGGAGEPCPGKYFRPNNDVTRGQLSKIVAAAAEQRFGWQLLSPPVPTFVDVPLDSPFYAFIETAYCHGIISGYANGTFGPGNSATRAQIAKIVCTTSQNPPATCAPPPR